MADLRAICERCGLSEVATYIQSGNVVFRSPLSAAVTKRTLEQALGKKLGKDTPVMLRDLAQLRRVVDDNPFAEAPPKFLMVVFYDKALSAGLVGKGLAPAGERLQAHGRELYVHYPDGMGKSRLKLPLQAESTARNLNTVNKLRSMLESLTDAS